MAGSEVNVKGLKELAAFLQTLPVRIEKNVLRGALRAGMSVVKPVAQQGVHSISGKLAKGLKVGTRAKGSTVTANLKATGPHAFVAHMLEMTGARPHQITPKVAAALSIGGRAYRSVSHPGFSKKPFLRPSLDRQARAAVIAAAEYMKLRLATKHGIDTAHIPIEGDE